MASTQALDTPSPKRGRPPTDPVERLRSQIWYLAVKARGNWSDYRLDVEFVREVGEEPQDGAQRRQAFERIRRHGTVPSTGNHHRRHYDLVERVDAHPDFAGTAVYFRSPFWKLMRSSMIGVPEVVAMVQECLRACQVIRPSSKLDLALRTFLIQRARVVPQDQRESIYSTFLSSALAERQLDLDTLALVGALYREACLVNALEIALILKKKLVRLLETYCQQDWLGQCGERLHLLAEQRLLDWQRDSRWRDAGLYDDFPGFVVERPILSLSDATSRLLQVEEEAFSHAIRRWSEVASETISPAEVPES